MYKTLVTQSHIKVNTNMSVYVLIDFRGVDDPTINISKV